MFTFNFLFAFGFIHAGFNLPINNYRNNNLIGGCHSTLYGCCLDNTTACNNFDCSNCNSTTSFNTTSFNTTSFNATSFNTTHIIGGCESTLYGCCLDNTTACSNFDCSNCNSTYIHNTNHTYNQTKVNHSVIWRRRESDVVY